MRIHAEFENVDMADLACANVKNNVAGIHRISITDKSFPSLYMPTRKTIISQGVNNVQPYVTEITQQTSDNSTGGSAKVDIICDPQSANEIKRRLISRGGLSIKELS